MNINLLGNSFISNSRSYGKVFRRLICQDNLLGKCQTLLGTSFNYAPKRRFSDGGDTSPKKLPPLMNYPQIVWPSVLKSIRNSLLITFIIKPYFDIEFTLPKFIAGTKKAVEVVSQKLAKGEVKQLEGLVTSDIIPVLEKAVSLMSLSQREQIAINLDDIYFSFPYQVGIIFNDDEPTVQRRFVEITMVFHAFKGLASMKEKGEEPSFNTVSLPEQQEKISVCNYRFVREFTKGVESDWTINFLNHFKLSEV